MLFGQGLSDGGGKFQVARGNAGGAVPAGMSLPASMAVGVCGMDGVFLPGWRRLSALLLPNVVPNLQVMPKASVRC